MTDNLDPPQNPQGDNPWTSNPVDPPTPPISPAQPPQNPPPSYGQLPPQTPPPGYGQQPPQTPPPSYGQQPPGGGYPPPPNPPQMGTYYSNQQGYNASGAKNDPFAITSLTCSIVGIPLLCCCFPIGGILGIIATVFGALSMNRIKKSQGELVGNGMAIAGLIIGIILIVSSIAMLIWSLVSGEADYSYYSDV